LNDRGKMMKVHIDRDGCIECGACEASCPEVFELKEGDKAQIVAKYQKAGPDEGEVEDSLSVCVRDAETSCPVEVISTGQ